MSAPGAYGLFPGEMQVREQFVSYGLFSIAFHEMTIGGRDDTHQDRYHCQSSE